MNDPQLTVPPSAGPMTLLGGIEPFAGVGAPPGGMGYLKVLDPLYVGAPAGNHKWTLVSVNRPTILFPLYGPDYAFTPWASIAQGAAGDGIDTFLPTLIYSYKQSQDDAVDPDITPNWQHAVHGGICYLDRAGDWWVGLDATVPLTVALIPIFDPVHALRYIDGLRPNHTQMATATLAAAGTGTAQAALLMGWDIRRRGWWIQNNSGGQANMRIGGATGTGSVIPILNGAIFRCGPDEAPWSPVMIEANAGGAVAGGLTFARHRL